MGTEQGSEPEPGMNRSEKGQKGERKSNVIIITVWTLSLYLNRHPRKPSKTDGSSDMLQKWKISIYFLVLQFNLSCCNFSSFFSPQTEIPSRYTEWMVLGTGEYMKVETMVTLLIGVINTNSSEE